MKTKQFNHNKIEECNLSKKEIDTENDNYSIIIDAVGDTIQSVKFYKTEILGDLIRGKGKIVEKNFIQRQQEIMNKVLGTDFLKNLNNKNKKEVFEIGT